MMLVPRKNHYTDLWDSIFSDPFFRDERHFMKTDIKEKESEYLIDIDMPGYDKEEIKVDVENGYLTVNAEHSENKDEKDKEGNFIHQERYYGNLSRSYYVGDAVGENDIKAAYKNGILSLTIPKKEKELPAKKYIAIE